MKYADMTPERAAKLKHYLRDRHKRLYVPHLRKESIGPYKFRDYDNEHRHIAAKALGKSLSSEIQIHHVDGNGRNNLHSNLIICPDRAYHLLLHRRQKALEECGNANWLRCVACGIHSPPQEMYLNMPNDQTSPRALHPACNRRYKEQAKKRKAERANSCSL